jgi:hypothetical protein|tara:strand:- start:1126 stop:1356 length:231 start_codon:yes stop_codon:yes gene_type:complete
MLTCKNKLFNKFLFFSFVFFTVSLFSHIMISYAANNPDIQQKISKQVKVRESISRIHMEQRQIIDRLENMEKRHVK